MFRQLLPSSSVAWVNCRVKWTAVIAVECAGRYSFMQKGLQMTLKSDYKADLLNFCNFFFSLECQTACTLLPSNWTLIVLLELIRLYQEELIALWSWLRNVQRLSCSLSCSAFGALFNFNFIMPKAPLYCQQSTKMLFLCFCSCWLRRLFVCSFVFFLISICLFIFRRLMKVFYFYWSQFIYSSLR